MKGRKRGRLQRIMIFFMALSLAFCAATFIFIKIRIEPNLEDISRMRAEVLVSRTVNKALTEQFSKEGSPERLFIVTKDLEGKTELVQANSVEINILITQLAESLQEYFRNMESEPIEVPIGTFLGSKILSGTGPSLELRVTPLSVISTDFRTELETEGINQTKYKIYMILECRVKVLAPFSSKTFDTSNTVLIAETVILGEVPDNFVQVPKEDILDAIN